MSRTPLKNLDEDENKISDYAYECARFIVFREGSKTAIRRDEIIRHLKDNFQVPRINHSKVLEAAQNILKKVYGYKLVDIGKNSYIVILNEKCEHHEVIYEPELRRLLIAALTHIFMSGGTVTEVNMIHFLRKAELVQKSDEETKKILSKTFTEQLYLEYKKPEEDDADHIFQWGVRAENEVSKMLLLEIMSKAFHEKKDFWLEQYNVAQEQEK